MNIKTRKILFLFFIFAFAIITPIVSLYAAGYKFSFSGKLLQKTGMLIVDSSPSGANILIDDIPQQKFLNNLRSKILNNTKKQNILKTPAKIKGLIPGEYLIKLEKDGYWSWEKKLKINPGSSTFAEDIVIFKNNLPQPISKGLILNTEQSPNKKLIAFITDNKYQIFDTSNENILYYEKPNNTNESLNENNIIWLDDDHVLFDYYLFSLKSWNKPLALSTALANVKFKNISFKNNSLIYILNDDKIIKLNLETKGIETLLNTTKIFDYLIKNNFTYTLEELENDTYLIVYENKKIIRKISLNHDDNYSFLRTEQKLINIYNSKFKTLYLVDPFDYFGPLKETINNVANSFWVNGDILVYYNDFEIWVYDRINFKKTIITRISNKIQDVLWHPSNNYIIYSTNDSLYTIELDNREKHSTNHLIKMNSINFLDINADGDILYFYSELGKQVGLYKLAI